jgi:phosphoglycolate phosphatase
MSIKGIIFDLDGTLINSAEDIADSLNLTLKQYGFEQHSTDDVKDWIGEGAVELIRKAIPAHKLVHLDIQKFLWEYREHYRENCAVKSYLYDGIPSLLDSLVDRKIQINILSNKPHELTLLVCEHFFSAWKFEHIFGMREHIPRKPDPSAVIEIVGKLGLQKSELLYIGDSGTDIETAKNAKIKVIAVSWGFRPRSELENQHADYLVDKPSELLDIIDSNSLVSR